MIIKDFEHRITQLENFRDSIINQAQKLSEIQTQSEDARLFTQAHGVSGQLRAARAAVERLEKLENTVVPINVSENNNANSNSS